MSHRIDCHVIIFNEPAWQIDRCLLSLKEQPVNIHLVQGVAEKRGQSIGRAKGFSMGQAEYVTYVDPDDWVNPGAFDILNACLGKYDVVHGKEAVVINGERLRVLDWPHHAFVIKRSANIDWSKGFSCGLSDHPGLSVRRIDTVTYNWDITGKTKYYPLAGIKWAR